MTTVPWGTTKHGKPRSNNQNRYMWSVVYGMIAEETGHTEEEIHEFCKATFLPRAFVTVGKHEREIPNSTAELDPDEMETYLMRIRAFAAAELGLRIPLPNEAL